MIKSFIIKKIVATSLLIVFAFSITPTIVFHNWLANHTDTCKKTADTKTQQLGNKTFNCHCDNIVAVSPFTQPHTLQSPGLIQIFSIVATAGIGQFPSSPHILYSLRGPPVV